jgi:hypothetical protein
MTVVKRVIGVMIGKRAFAFKSLLLNWGQGVNFELSGQNKTQKDQNLSLTEDISILRGSVVGKTQEIDSLTLDIGGLRSSYDLMLKSMEIQVSELQERNVNLDSARKMVSENEMELQSQNHSIFGRLKDLEDEKSKIGLLLTKFQNEAKTLEQTKTTQESQIKFLKTKNWEKILRNTFAKGQESSNSILKSAIAHLEANRSALNRATSQQKCALRKLSQGLSVTKTLAAFQLLKFHKFETTLDAVNQNFTDRLHTLQQERVLHKICAATTTGKLYTAFYKLAINKNCINTQETGIANQKNLFLQSAVDKLNFEALWRPFELLRKFSSAKAALHNARGDVLTKMINACSAGKVWAALNHHRFFSQQRGYEIKNRDAMVQKFLQSICGALELKRASAFTRLGWNCNQSSQIAQKKSKVLQRLTGSSAVTKMMAVFDGLKLWNSQSLEQISLRRNAKRLAIMRMVQNCENAKVYLTLCRLRTNKDTQNSELDRLWNLKYSYMRRFLDCTQGKMLVGLNQLRIQRNGGKRLEVLKRNAIRKLITKSNIGKLYWTWNALGRNSTAGVENDLRKVKV